MAGQKIHQYLLERLALGDDDYFDIDYWDGLKYKSAKIKGSTIKSLISGGIADAPSDNEVYARLNGAWSSGILQDVIAGTNITIDKTDPQNPIINASGGSGSSGLTTTTLSGATILNTTYDVVLCGGGTSYTVTLPAALSNPNKSYYIKNLNPNGDDIIIDGAGYNIDGSPTFRLDPYNHSVRIISDGTHWRVLNESGNLSKDTSFTQVNRDGTIFTWNDVTNPTTGRTWMDRNLGATQVAASPTDSLAYGHLYQWGRLKDGHELRTSAVSSVLSKDNSPLNGDFIENLSSPYDWRSPQNNNLWQGVNGENNICPPGYRLPTQAEWQAEIATWGSLNPTGAFQSVLKLPVAGYRNFGGSALLNFVGTYGYYWSSAVNGANSNYLLILSNNAYMHSNRRAYGFSVRLIKD